MSGKILRAAAVLIGGMAAPAFAELPEPAEPVPEHFFGPQYVDSKGCVFLRASYGTQVAWVPRVNAAHQQMCGYPPSLSAEERGEMLATEAPAPDVAGAAPSAPLAQSNDVGSETLALDLPASQTAAAPQTPDLGAADQEAPEQGTADQDISDPGASSAQSSVPPAAAQSPRPAQGTQPAMAAPVETKPAAVPQAAPKARSVAAKPAKRKAPARDKMAAKAAAEVVSGVLLPADGPAVALLCPSTLPLLQRFEQRGESLSLCTDTRARRAEARPPRPGPGAGPAAAAQAGGTEAAAKPHQLGQRVTVVLRQRDAGQVTQQVTRQGKVIEIDAVGRRVVSLAAVAPEAAKLPPQAVKAAPLAPPPVSSAQDGAYVAVGAFAVSANAQGVVSRLRAAQLPVARGTAGKLHLVMSGPFADQQALDRAIKTLRQAGFADLQILR